MRCSVDCLVDWPLQLNSTEKEIKCLLAEQGGTEKSIWTQSGCLRWLNLLLHCKFSFSSLRDLYSQFLKEMIIQPGIAKANLGVSREDVTLEDHVSVVKPLCCRKFSRAVNRCSGIWMPGLLLALFSPVWGTVPKYQPGTRVLATFSVNYWQSTSCFQLCISLLPSCGASCPGCGSPTERERLTRGTSSKEALSWEGGLRAGWSQQRV